MADTKKTKNDGEVISDVAKPDETVPPSTSKPILISHRPVLKDPMMVDDQAAQADDKEVSQAPLKPSSKLKISPISVEPLQTTEDTKNTTPAEEETSVAEAEANDDTVEKDTSSDDSFVSDGDETTKKKSDATDIVALEKEAKRAAELAKLVEEKKYYLPINQSEKRRNKHYAIGGLLLIIILGLAWADVALDAGLVNVPGVKAPTHFFSK